MSIQLLTLAVQAGIRKAITNVAAPIGGPLQLGGSLRAPSGARTVALAPDASVPAPFGPSSGLGNPIQGAAPMSLLGDFGFGFGGGNGNGGGFLPSSDFSSLVQGGIGLINALRSNRSTSNSGGAVLPGAGLVQGDQIPPFPGPMGTVIRAGREIGQQVGTQVGRARGPLRRRRRMNPLNVRAARRAIRRIKAVRKITAQIERSLPTRKVHARGFGSPGVITRAEASRALRR